jgi:23S rRNA (cytidine1920-2'-O)/16S rRNA (cytidine1409-2'-O)-methyltransferase
MKQRLDRLLLEKGLVTSRTQAANLISEGHVLVEGAVISKPSIKVSVESVIEISKELVFVGRGAHKIEGAFSQFNLSFEDKIVGDMGASTGGFTEFALYKGAQKVYAVDVGVDQLATKLKEDPRVINYEGLNIREGLPFADCDILVTDLSFISLNLVLAPMASCLVSGGEFVFLVKPQFEVGRVGLGKNGIVKDESLIISAILSVIEKCHDLELSVINCCACPLRGKMGNQEFFIYGVKDPLKKRIDNQLVEEIIKASL